MPSRPPPLLPGTHLNNRFELQATLGQGDFGITYRARDLHRGDLCIIRELAPAGSARDESGILFLSKLGEASSQLIRQRFQKEARRWMRFSGPSLPLIRATFTDFGTAFFAREHIPQATTLTESIVQEGKLEVEYVRTLSEQLATALNRLHAQGVLHLDLRPSNVLLNPKGHVYLIDFGEARKWHRDLFKIVDFGDPLPPELRSRGSLIGPAADVFALAAVLYAALAGFPPAPYHPDQSEAPLRLDQIRQDVPESMASIIDQGLRFDPQERPSMFDFISFGRRFSNAETPEEVVKRFDTKALALKQLRFSVRECPSCNGVLENPKPLRLGICPVCHEGSIRERKIEPNLCPNCRMAFLRQVPNVEPLSVCPLCTEGLLHRHRKKLLSKEFVYGCDNCEVTFEWNPPHLVVVSPPPGSHIHQNESLIAAEWRERSGRADEIWHCSGCGAQYDVLPDRRWKQMVPSKTGKYEALEPPEWARVAAGLPPDAGNAECDACGADYYFQGNDVALLESRSDPHHFAAHNSVRLTTLEELRWLGVRKESPNPGLICAECETELDFDGDKYKLIRSQNPGMLEFLGQSKLLEDWHRAAKELPLTGKETGFDEAFASALRDAYVAGSLPFSSRDADLLWKGPAIRFERAPEGWKQLAEGQLEVDEGGFRMGGLIKKWKLAFGEVQNMKAIGRRLELGDVSLDLEPVDVTAHLESGSRVFRLNPGDLASRLRALLESRQEQATA